MAERIAIGFVEAERQRRAGLPGAEVVALDGLALCFAGVPAPELNGALVEREPSDAVAALAAAEEESRRRNRTFGIDLQVGRQPVLDDAVRAAGLHRLFERPGLAARAVDLPAAAAPEGVRIEPVTDDRGADGLGRVDAAAFDDPPEVAHGFYGRASRHGGRCFVAWSGGEPVGIASAYLHARAVGVLGVGVVPHARRRGLGAALTLAAARAFPRPTWCGRIRARWRGICTRRSGSFASRHGRCGPGHEVAIGLSGGPRILAR
ncbi:MAG TPA: GNAT family N-acetyltransferase [Actinomycetota bacterium]|nr:GNAT family N-acetyltransferase [Actinomycetota bacterium]